MTRALASTVEAAEYICLGRSVVLCIEDIKPGTSFAGSGPILEAERKDLNRMRSYLRDVAVRNGVPFTSSIDDAMGEVLKRFRKLSPTEQSSEEQQTAHPSL